MKVILASASERRQELLKRIVDDFQIIVSDFDEESIRFNGDFNEYVQELAKGKAKWVADNIDEDAIIIGCDTIVAFNGKVLGKPKDETHAFNMLKALSGNTHCVYSGIAILDTKNNIITTESVCTNVKFSTITNENINKYISTKEPMDKAGAYGIQGLGGVFVEEINGDYYNVVGLPINRLYKIFRDMGVNL